MNTISYANLKLLDNPIIIDIRDNYSYNISHIKNSLNIPYYNLLNNYSHYLNKNNTYYLYCDEGKQIMKMIILITLLLIIMVSLFIKYYSKKTLPILISYAKSETKKLTILIINKAITKEVTSLEPDELFDIIYTQDGDIQMIDFNSQNTNKILSTMTIDEKIHENDGEALAEVTIK